MNSPASYIGTDIAGQFRILQRIGSGGMGAVYKAEQPEMNRFVAIKILHPKYVSRPDLVSRFRREARAMSHLSHPNTARVFMYGQLEDGACYIVMEHLEGKNLGQIVRQEGPMEPLRAIGILLLIALYAFIWREAGHLDNPAHRALARGLVLMYASASFGTSMLNDHVETLLFVWMNALLFAGYAAKARRT